MKIYKNITIENQDKMDYKDLLNAVETEIEKKYPELSEESAGLIAMAMVEYDEDIVEIDDQFYPASNRPDEQETEIDEITVNTEYIGHDNITYDAIMHISKYGDKFTCEGYSYIDPTTGDYIDTGERGNATQDEMKELWSRERE